MLGLKLYFFVYLIVFLFYRIFKIYILYFLLFYTDGVNDIRSKFFISFVVE